MQKVDRPTSLTKLNENCGLQYLFTDYQIRHLGNPSRLPEILLKIDPCIVSLLYHYHIAVDLNKMLSLSLSLVTMSASGYIENLA